MSTITTTTNSGITTLTEGRRTYLIGNTYGIRDEIRAAGGHWDADRRAWWIGSGVGKQDDLRKLLAIPASRTASRTPDDPASIQVRGKARHRGRVYFVRWAGIAKRGYAMRLVSLDASIDFWVAAQERGGDGQGEVAAWTKHYAEPRSLAGIARFVAEQKAVQAGARECSRCAHHPAYNGSGDYDSCRACGRTYRIAH